MQGDGAESDDTWMGSRPTAIEVLSDQVMITLNLLLSLVSPPAKGTPLVGGYMLA